MSPSFLQLLTWTWFLMGLPSVQLDISIQLKDVDKYWQDPEPHKYSSYRMADFFGIN